MSGSQMLGTPAVRNVAPWPHASLDVPALLADGWRPVPFRDVVLKVHQRCNLACDYCYVYTMADQSWRDRPRTMDRDVWLAAADRMAEHARAHDLPSMRLILHGGEPLLAGGDRLASLIEDFRAVVSPVCELDVKMQTNGVLLDEVMLARLRQHGVGVGISLDGTPADNDRYRRFPDGRGTFAAVDRALRLLGSEEYRSTFSGLLCTVDPTTDPLACYETLLRYRPPMIDLLLPHANWSAPPARSPDDGPHPLADWLIAVFDRWFEAPRRETRIRLFEDIIALTLGGSGRSEQIGLSPVAVVVVETDGAIEQVDSLKATYAGACDTGLNVRTDAFGAALLHPGVVARQIGVRALSETCRRCPIHKTCGGGHYVHRFRAGDGFRNPSVYCADIFHLVQHVTNRVGNRSGRTAEETDMTAYHQLPADRFAALGSGLGGPEAVTELAAAQSSKRRLLLRHLLHALPGEAARPIAEALIEADRRDRQVIVELMTDPLVGAWATRTVRRLVNDANVSGPLEHDLAQIGALAATAALRTGQTVSLEVRPLDGRVTLPTLGTAVIGSEGRAVIEVADGSATISDAADAVRVAPDDPRWRPLRRLSARDNDLAASVAVEDGNPFRDCYHAPPSDRLDRGELLEWQELFDGAWSLLVRYLPLRAAELSAGLRAVIPLATQDGDMARSGTSRDTFGALGLTRPRSATDFAITLVHEFQHSKLSGLLDLVPLSVPGGTERHFAPWREDPRPTSGLFQGVYAFLGVADAWNGLRQAPGLEDEATREFAVFRRQVDAGLSALEQSSELTERGGEFVSHLRGAVDRLLAEAVPAPVDHESAVALADCREAWEQRNRRSTYDAGQNRVSLR